MELRYQRTCVVEICKLKVLFAASVCAPLQTVFENSEFQITTWSYIFTHRSLNDSILYEITIEFLFVKNFMNHNISLTTVRIQKLPEDGARTYGALVQRYKDELVLSKRTIV
jgi:hypothetical protein